MGIACPGYTNTNISNSSMNSTTYCLPGSWAQQGIDLIKESSFRQYVTSMYWATATEFGVALSCMISGVVFFGYIIASVTASSANADSHRSRFQPKLDSVKRFLKEHDVVESSLAKRVKEFYNFLWNRNKGVNLESLFEGLPNSLQADTTLSLYKDLVRSVPLLQGTELGFTKMLLYIQPLLLPKGEYIVRKGDIGEEMYFIHKGIVKVASEHDNPVVFDTISAGCFFGEINTIFSCPTTASVRTRTNTDLFVLKKNDLDIVLGHYAHIRTQIIETAEERQVMVQKRARVAAEKKAEENRQKTLNLFFIQKGQVELCTNKRFTITGNQRPRRRVSIFS